MQKITKFLLLLFLCLSPILNVENIQAASWKSNLSYQEVPKAIDNKQKYAVINDNNPKFSDDLKKDYSYEKYGNLDRYKRCTGAIANVGKDLMPTEKRGSISKVKPVGWQIKKYEGIDGKYLYNRCHLIGYQLSGENANKRNLITGTRYLNVEGMLPFENMIADYVKTTNNHVLYRVTPIYHKKEKLARGVQMEALSLEDNGAGIKFNVIAYNVQPGIEIDYKTGNSRQVGSTEYDNEPILKPLPEKEITPQKEVVEPQSQITQVQPSVSQQPVIENQIFGNSRSHIYHCPGQKDYENMRDSKYLVVFSNEQEAIQSGYRKAMR